MDKKRLAEENGHEGPDQKKSRTNGPSGAPSKPGLNLEALQKAKQLLEKQKQLREKLKKLPQVASSAGAAAGAPSAAALAATANPLAPGGVPGVDAALVAAKAAKAVEIASKFGVQASLASVPGIQPAPGAAAPRPLLTPPVGALPGVRPAVPSGVGGLGGPRPLLLDAAGREVDEAGNVITHAARAPITTSLINQRRPDEPQQAPEPSGPRDEDFIDTSMARPGKDAAAHRRRRGALEFVEEGSMARQAEIMRLKQKYGEADFKKHLPSHLRRPPRGPAGPAERDANLTPLGAPPIPGLAGAAVATVVPGSEAQGVNLVPIGVRQVEESEEDKLRRMLPEAAAPPEVEWWDKPLLVGGAYFVEGNDQPDGAADGQQQAQEDGIEQRQDQQREQPDNNVVAAAPDASGAVMRLRLGKVTLYVEHPVPMEPPAAGPPPPPQPLKLTKKELKKMRTQRRQAREKEKQELIRQGLLEPPKPKVKISNLMRVLGEEATLDPTAIEQEVRRQMGERQAAHDDRNLARMLTPAERRDKKLRKLFDNTPGGALTTRTAVYRVEDLSHGQHRFKVDVNARENHVSGIMLLCPGTFNLVVVEGCPKSLKRYHKLMLRRIDWNATPLPQPGEDEEDAIDAAAAGAGAEDKPPNSCHLVWEGEVGSASFKDFSKEEVASPEAARKLLDERGVAHYWDAAANFDFDAAPLPELP